MIKLYHIYSTYDNYAILRSVFYDYDTRALEMPLLLDSATPLASHAVALNVSCRQEP